MYSLYIIQSIHNDRWYIGIAEDVNVRLKQHNMKKVRSTKAYAPYQLIHQEEYGTKTEALKREIQLKRSGKLRKELKEKIDRILANP